MRDPALYLRDILLSIDLVQEYAEGLGLADFSEDQQLQDAVLRRIEIIGEAVKALPEGIRNEHPEVPWRRIAGTRDKVAHDYLGVDLELIWNLVGDLLPDLRVRIQGVLDSLPPPA